MNDNYFHREMSLGPKENDVMKDLKIYCFQHHFLPTNHFKDADIIITNTIFSDDIIEYAIKNHIPLIKRYDGVFWKNSEKERNISLNNSAIIANHTIFISDYSQKAFHTLYPELKLKSESVILNNVDNSIFCKKKDINELIWCASATNWQRSEKRFNELLKFAQICTEPIYLMGRCDLPTPKNIIKFGYLDNSRSMVDIINECSAFVNLTYRDAGAKVVSQGLNCGLPVLYASSGGVPELVGEYGVSINDNQEISFDDIENELDSDDILESYNNFKNNFYQLKNIIKARDYRLTMKEYFDTLKKFL
jgi:glycosyltransferase involved in cell wall biosynthesis